ncbi:hypothetical protein ACHHYP_01966 [Achlya hypogyna]|uniref:DH domain-containing protein n=1 Tax=Achlya hypogyna TaxID=1202772 RepID=A0A1V9ZSM8_ACHHY|nr:hypothetical protein ACHHYP_01966 [Achlya hypogyna]
MPAEGLWQRIVQELIATEATYVALLSTLLDGLLLPLERSFVPEIRRAFQTPEVLPSFGLHGILAQLRDQHALFLGKPPAPSALTAAADELRAETWSDATLSGLNATLTLFAKVFRPLHAAYAVRHEDATAAFGMLRRNPAVAAVVAAFEAQRHEPVASLLILPIQRLPRYVLLLRELEKHVMGVGGARLAMETTASHVNVALQTVANTHKLLALQPLFPALDLAAKTWLRDGRLTKTTVQSRSAPRECLFHLFSDVLVYSDVAAYGPLRVRSVLPLADVVLAKSPDDKQPAIALVTARKCMLLTAETPALTAAWWQHLMMAAGVTDPRPETTTLRGLLEAPKDLDLGTAGCRHVVWFQKDRALKLGVLFVNTDVVVVAQCLALDKYKYVAHVLPAQIQGVDCEGGVFRVGVEDATQWILYGSGADDVVAAHKQARRRALVTKSPASEDNNADHSAVPMLPPGGLDELKQRLADPASRRPPPLFAPPVCPLQQYPPPIPAHRKKVV